uniref:Glutathione peroxidase n=1 Tax=Paulinella chromatophora TaxID=39717 RepID=B1X4L9_PAUCH|nr:Glutathione peroxidase [Paulinella chromatophora]ACB42888.1 Glutathione peroxidase [Paulinella chromatophora]
MSVNVSNSVVKRSNGSDLCLGEYTGKVLLIINLASRCGFTRQYAGLQKLQDDYGAEGLKVLGFPCNDFGNQEPGTVEKIQEFCSTVYGVNFEIFDKVSALENKSAPYDLLTQSEPFEEIAWNFEKFLIDKKGYVIGRYKSGIEPDDAGLVSDIVSALNT